MCLQCHQGLSDEHIISDLESITESGFIKWNTTSMSHLKLAALGMNGPIARNLAIDIFTKFIKWRKTQPANYVPQTGLENMTSAYELEQDLNYITTHSPDFSNKHSIIENYDEFKKTSRKSRRWYDMFCICRR